MTTEATLTTVLEEAFDDYAIDRRVRVGERNTVYAARADGQRVACKLTDCQPGVLAREARLQRAVGESAPVAVPDVLASTDGCLVLEWLDAEPFGDHRQRGPERFRAVGAALARLHAATANRFDGHGTLAVDGDGLAVEEGTDWPTRFATFVQRWADDLDGTSDADVGAAVLDAVIRHSGAFADVPPVLIHGEASPDHVLLDDDTVALIDWELGQAAPGGFDLVWAERDLLGRPLDDGHAEIREVLLDGYREVRALGDAFDCRRELYRAGFATRELGLWHDPDRAVENERENHRKRLRSFVFDRLDAAGD
ncbi:fructosamine-3-kinase [Halolamina pelagica]|uniref:Fructosamine-3-kinase n=1 Tax=Halolamina pelagica TaxID=699431 RepID=A0A0P7GVJ1_9EURY|nr:phosphotransferase [Halolamina pelagica]KPN29556.1 fructosamine-3-kinase [Halolamina pelagica]